MFSVVFLQQWRQFESTYQCIIITTTNQRQLLHQINVNEATPVSDCYVIEPNPTLVSELISAHQTRWEYIIVTSTTQLQRHYVITATLLIQLQHVYAKSKCYWNVKVAEQRQHVNPISICHWNVKASVQR